MEAIKSTWKGRFVANSSGNFTSSNLYTMKKIFRFAVFYCLFATFSLTATHVNAGLYPKEIKFQHILQNRDIVVGEVRSILQDSQGYMWFGGWNSLVRFDGYEVIPVFLTTEEAGKTALVPVAMTTTLFEDKNHIIWVGTGQGLLRYDPKKDELKPLKNIDGELIQINKTHILGMDQAPTGELLIGSMDGMLVLDPKTQQYTSMKWNPDNWTDPNHPGTPSMPCAFVDKSGGLWFCSEKGIDKFDLESQQFTHVNIDPNTNERVAIWIKDMAQAEDGKFWLASEYGVVRFDPETGDSKRYVHNPDDPNSLGQNNIWDVMVDTRGRIWIASDQGGLNLYNPEKDNFIRYKSNEGKSSSIASNVVRTVVEDSSGDIWLGFYPEGVDFFDQSTTGIVAYTNNPNDSKSISSSSVLSMVEDKQGNFWIGTDGGGLNYFDRKEETFSSFTHDPDNTNSIAANAVLSVFLDSENILWMGHWDGGVTRYDPSTQQFSRLPMYSPNGVFASTSEALNSRHVWTIYEDKNHDFWFGTHTGGLAKYDREKQTYDLYWSDPNDPTTVNSEWIWCILEDSKNNFWIGTNNGLSLMDRDTGTFKRYLADSKNLQSLSDFQVLSLHEDKKGRLWVGTNVGLNLYDEKQQNFTHITTEDGLNNDSIRQILEDENGTLWLGTANGVSSFNPDTGKIKNFNRDGGELVGSFNYGAGTISSSGEIFMGGVNGLRMYKPKELQDNHNIPPIAFTQLKIYSDVIGVDGPDGILEKDLNYTDKIRLDYTKSMFEISFAALNFRDPGKNQYSYMLEGFDEEWLSAGDQRTAKYTNLDAGTYTFRVKASNNDGVWNEEGKRITIVQMPPWWETWWAYTFYVLCILGMFAWSTQRQSRQRMRVEEQNRELETKVAERTTELRQKNQDIQAMLGNMRQGLFTVEKGGCIHPEYSQYLETIFETKAIAGKDFMDFLFARSHLGSNELDQIKEASNAILGEDEMNFEFNSHLFFNEYDADIEGHRKHLSLDWNAIVVDDVVTKLMVSVRDVTDLKKMESEARTQKRELDIISQLLNVSNKKFGNFERNVQKFIQENRKKIMGCNAPDGDVVALLFRNMHTIKGNSRTYGFSYLSDIAHEAETTYNAMKAQGGDETGRMNWKADTLLQELKDVEATLFEYSDIFHRVLGRGNDAPAQNGPDGIWLDSKALRSINSSISNIQLHTGYQIGLPELQAVQNNSDIACNSTLDEVLEDIIDSLPSIASQLDKPVPQVTIDTRHVRFKEDAFDLMNNVFSHILRNCIDHGIERPAEREEKGKDAAGKIMISTKSYADHLDIHISDDGRGLNIAKLRRIGVNLGKWSETDDIDRDDIAQLIFASGVSTSDAVTDISGRGVGMDAVSQYLKECGGKACINLLQEEGDKDFLQFEIVVSLPPAYYAHLKKAS
ncbi:Chemotaxis protein CheA [Thalassocella blandensis]|nr:Chemotaxis protein CheA [Thalassocella blandensis]